MLNGIVKVIKNYLSEKGVNCRVSKNQIQIAYTGSRGGYDTIIAYYTNKSAGVQLYIDYDLSRNIENEILMF